MKNLFLHIGTHKTGSTAIQHFLYENRAALLQQGVYYPCEGTHYFDAEKSQSFLAHSLLDRYPNYLRHSVALDRDRCVNEIRRDVSNSDCKSAVLSSEHFSLATTSDQWRRVHEALAPLAESIRVIVYLTVRQRPRASFSWTKDP